MAIKGKGKAGRRTVTRGPRPGYVEPPKPLYKRTWFRVSALCVLILLVGSIIASIVLITKSNNRKEKAAELAHTKQGNVQKIVGPVTQYLQAVAEPLGGGTQVAPFKDLATQFADLQSGKLSSEDAKKAATTVVTNAKTAAENIGALDVSTLADTSTFPDLVDLLDAQSELKSSMQLFGLVGTGLGRAADATGDARNELIAENQAIIPIATATFTDGYQKLVNAQISVGLPPNVFPAPQPTPSPEPSASASASSKPEPTGSAKGGNGNGGGGKASPKPSAS
jgi:hypothetical protein